MPESTRSRLRGNLSLVISCLALVVALSGTAYAVGLAPGSVDTKALAKGAVTTKKLHAKAVSAPKIKPGAVGSKALADGSVGAAKLLDGSVGAAELADGSVGAAELLDGSVGAAELADGSVGSTKLADSSVGTAKITDRSIRLHDLGGVVGGQVGPQVNSTATIPFAINLTAGQCTSAFLELFNPLPPGILGSMVVGTITTSTGGPVFNNAGFVVPTLATETNQGGVILHLGLCAGSAAQTIPAGSIVTWSLIAP